MKKKIYLSSPHMSGFELDYINEAFETNWIAPLGANIDGFEKEVCKYTGAKYAVALSSGTAAIHMGLKYLGVEKGDYVFCSSLTFSASCNPILYQGAIPVFIDSDYETWNISSQALEKAFRKYPNPKAIVTVNLYGQSADYDKIKKIAGNYNVPVLEDAAESLGATYKGRQTGTLGDIGIYSFNGNKIITTSGGGMLVADNPDTINKIKFWATQSKEDLPYYHHKEIGYNYRMSNIVAGIGRGQMCVLDERIAKKKYIYEYYKNAFEEIDEIEMMPIADYGSPNYWLSCMTIKKESAVRAKDIIQTLALRNIEARHIWKPLHKQPIFKQYDYFTSYVGETSCSEDIFNRGICLPSDTKMTDYELGRITEIIKGIFESQSMKGLRNAL
jgi:dTDP-4-amino-4,6-dideoxygalactose transaminase